MQNCSQEGAHLFDLHESQAQDETRMSSQNPTITNVQYPMSNTTNYQLPMTKIQDAVLLVGIWDLDIGIGHWIFDGF